MRSAYPTQHGPDVSGVEGAASTYQVGGTSFRILPHHPECTPADQGTGCHEFGNAEGIPGKPQERSRGTPGGMLPPTSAN